MIESDERLWNLSCAFSYVINNEIKSFDIYKELSRIENQYTKKSHITDILLKLQEHDVKVIGKYGKLYCNEKGRWIYKQERLFLKSSSLRFLGQGLGTMRRSFRTLSVEEPRQKAEIELEKNPKQLLRRFSTTDAKISSPDSTQSTTESMPCSHTQIMPSSDNDDSSHNNNNSPNSKQKNMNNNYNYNNNHHNHSDNSISTTSPTRRKSGLFHSLSARTMNTIHTASDDASIGQLYNQADIVPARANLPVTEQANIIFDALWDELLPSLIIYEAFLLLGTTWLGDGSKTSVAASQRRLLEKVNSRTGILNTTSLIDQIKYDRTSNLSGISSGGQSPRNQLSRTPSNASLLGSDDVKGIHTIDTDLLNEMLLDIEENAMIIIPDINDSELSDEIQIIQDNKERTRTTSSSNNYYFDNILPPTREKTPINNDKHRNSSINSDKYPLNNNNLNNLNSNNLNNRSNNQIMDLLHQESLNSIIFSETDSQIPFINHSNSFFDSPRNSLGKQMTSKNLNDQDNIMYQNNNQNNGSNNNSSNNSNSNSNNNNLIQNQNQNQDETTLKTLRFAPSVPLKRPSWSAPAAPLYFARKRRPGMAVRLALSQNGPFQRILAEGVRVIIHCMYPNDKRPRRIQRIMMIDDGKVKSLTWSDSYDINDYIHIEAKEKDIPILKLRFHKFEAGILVETNDFIPITSVSEILTGVHTSAFKKSLNQLYGEGSSYEKSGTEKRCFSMLGCVSPFDERHCLDIEIQPIDKQKPEELQAASMIALGVATAIQVMSNLANTTDVHEVGMIGSLNQVFKSIHERSEGTESILSDNQSKTASSVGTKTSRNTTPPESRFESSDEKSMNSNYIHHQSISGIFPDLNSINSDKLSNDQQSILSNNTNENEKSINSFKFNNSSNNSLSGSTNSNSVLNSPLLQRGKRVNSLIPILEATSIDNQPSPLSNSIKRRHSKSFDGMLQLDAMNPRSKFEKDRPKSFTLAPNTPLTPLILALFDEKLPSEQYTINYIMQEVVELWTAIDKNNPQQHPEEENEEGD